VEHIILISSSPSSPPKSLRVVGQSDTYRFSRGTILGAEPALFRNQIWNAKKDGHPALFLACLVPDNGPFPKVDAYYSDVSVPRAVLFRKWAMLATSRLKSLAGCEQMPTNKNLRTCQNCADRPTAPASLTRHFQFLPQLLWVFAPDEDCLRYKSLSWST
jgi:hypothetical protein